MKTLVAFLLAALVLSAGASARNWVENDNARNFNLTGANTIQAQNITGTVRICLAGDCRTSWPSGGGGSGMTVASTDSYISVANGSTTNISANLTTFDTRYTLLSSFTSYIAAVYNNITGVQSGVAGVAANVSVVNSSSITRDAALATNITNLQTSNTSIHARVSNIETVNANQNTSIAALASNISSVNSSLLTRLGQVAANISSVNATAVSALTGVGTVNATAVAKAGTGTASCSDNSTHYAVVQNVTTTTGAPTTTCIYVPKTSSSSGGGLSGLSAAGVLVATNSTNAATDAGLTYDTSTNVLSQDGGYTQFSACPDGKCLRLPDDSGLYSTGDLRVWTEHGVKFFIDQNGTNESISDFVVAGKTTSLIQTTRFLTVDTTGGGVVIGNASSTSYQLEVVGDAAIQQDLLVEEGITVGNGTNMPLVYLNAERDWALGVAGSGASSYGYIRDLGNDKQFKFLAEDEDYNYSPFIVHTSNTNGTSRVYLVADNGGKVGVNTTSPNQLFEVRGNGNVSANLYAGALCLNGSCQSSWIDYAANISAINASIPGGVNASGAYGLQGVSRLANGSYIGYGIADQTQSGQPLAVRSTLNSNGSVNISLIVPTTTDDEVLGWDGTAFTERNITGGSGASIDQNVNTTGSPSFAAVTASSGDVSITSGVLSIAGTTRVSNAGRFAATGGSAGSPGFYFQADSSGDTGVWRIMENVFGLSAGSVSSLNVTATGVNITNLCLSGDCKTAWPTGGSGSGNITGIGGNEQVAIFNSTGGLNTQSGAITVGASSATFYRSFVVAPSATAGFTFGNGGGNSSQFDIYSVVPGDELRIYGADAAYRLQSVSVAARSISLDGNTTISAGNKIISPEASFNNGTGQSLVFFSNSSCAGWRNPTNGATLCLG